MILVHSSEIETLKTFILKEKRLDLLGRNRNIQPENRIEIE